MRRKNPPSTSRKRDKKKRLRALMQYAYLPLSIVFMEILLRLLCGYPFWPGLFFAVIVSIGTGFAICIVSQMMPNPTASRVVACILLGLHCVVFSLQYFMFNTYRVFMSFEAIFQSAGNVIGEFTNVFLATIVTGIPIIIGFFLPFIAFVILTRKKGIPYSAGSKKLRFRRISTLIVMLIVSIISQMIILAVNEENMAAHAAEFNFDNSSRRLGILTGLGLEMRYGIFGNPHTYSSFSIEETPPPATLQNPHEDPESHNTTGYDNDYPTISITIETPPPRVFGENVLEIDFEYLVANERNSRIRSVHDYVAGLNPSLQNEHTGIFEGKNLILITAEAFSKQVIDPVMTPTLYRLANNGFFFSDYYQPAWGSSTSGGEYSIITGFAPTSGTRSIQTVAAQNASFTMGNQLMRRGYFSAAYHNGTHTYYSRHNTHTRLGYSTFTARGNGMEGHVRGVWPASDLEMIEFSLPQYIDNSPFSVYYMMISGHALYTRTGNSMANKNWNAFPEQYDKMSSFIRAYMASNLELEYALEYLIDSLEAAGIADDTVIVISTDHYPYGLEHSASWGTDKDYLGELFGFPVVTPADRDQSALIIWSASLENEHKNLAIEIASPTFSLDILPTLYNLFGLEYDSRLFVGRDIFSDAYPIVFWLDRSWKTDRGFFRASTGTFTPAPDAEIAEDYVSQIRSIVNNRINFSGSVLDHDYFNLLFNSDGTLRSFS